MKNVIHIIILAFIAASCQTQELNVDCKNLEINIPGRPGPWIAFNDNFYCYFKTDNDKFSSGSNHQFYIIDKKGQIKSKIDVPKKLQTFYYDLYIKNDTIFTTEYYDHNTFYLDKNNNWIETKKGIDLYYDDKDYSVYSLDFGEWGGVTWFKDKQTGKQFEIGATTPIVNKLGESYYLTAGKSVLKIDNPKKLDKSQEPYVYQKAVLDERFRREGNHSTNGAEIIFEYENDDYFNPTFSLATSFISNDKLYHLYKDSISTKIGTVENKKLIPSYEFKSEIRPFQWNYDSRNPIQNNSFQSVQFRTDKDSVYGIIEISNNDFKVTYFNNIYKEPVFGEKKMNGWLENTFENYYSNFSALTLDQIDNVEQDVNAIDITQKHKISTYRLDGRNVKTPRIYRKIESDKLRLIVMYYYSENDQKIQLISFEWGKNRNKNQSIEDVVASMSNKEKGETIYKQKFDYISNYLKGKLGEPDSSKSKKYGVEQKWTKDEKIVILEYSQRDVELTIYSE
ncbi:hypothetical protein [uncultured Aquimarina sp.]|uniref:hypothetical protein n=1 Tax=uncultured Aquimarina sp. TaxID=575652 RepID=UPI002621DF87|nr:hypothetical protein [uncultured Aquimarina sp.]